MLSNHGYYAFEVNQLFSNYAEKFLSTQTKYLNMYIHTSSIFGHAQNCSQTLLQHFDDAVITFIRQEKTVNYLSSACPNIEVVYTTTATL